MTQQQTAGPPSAGHADLAEEFLDRQTPLSRIRNILHRYPAVSPALVLLISVVVFGLLNDRFLRVENLSLITQQVSVVGTLAIAQTLIILTAGIDLSVGAVMILSSMVMAQLAVNNGVPAPIALLAGLVVGLAAGALNAQTAHGVQPIWEQVLRAKPDVFVLLGDNVYADTNDPVELRAAYASLPATARERVDADLPRGAREALGRG